MYVTHIAKTLNHYHSLTNHALVGASLSEPQFSDADGTFVCAHKICINLHKIVLHGHTANTLTYLFQRHVRDAKIIPRHIGGKVRSNISPKSHIYARRTKESSEAR